MVETLVYPTVLIAAKHDLDGARRLAHVAEENLLDLAFFELSKMDHPEPDVALVWEKLPAMRKNVVMRAKLIDLALRLSL